MPLNTICNKNSFLVVRLTTDSNTKYFGSRLPNVKRLHEILSRSIFESYFGCVYSTSFGKRTPKFWIRLDWIAVVPAGMELFSDLFHAMSQRSTSRAHSRLALFASRVCTYLPAISSASFICLYTVVSLPNTCIWHTFPFNEL